MIPPISTGEHTCIECRKDEVSKRAQKKREKLGKKEAMYLQRDDTPCFGEYTASSEDKRPEESMQTVVVLHDTEQSSPIAQKRENHSLHGFQVSPKETEGR